MTNLKENYFFIWMFYDVQVVILSDSHFIESMFPYSFVKVMVLSP